MKQGSFINVGLIFIGMLVASLPWISCHQSPNEPAGEPELVSRPAFDWPVSTLVGQGLDSVKVMEAVEEAKTYPYLHSLIVVKNGFLVTEYYQPPYTKENDYDIRSASKSFISALVGIAIDRRAIDSVDHPILGFFPGFDTAGIDPRKRMITIRHLLEMRGGFDYTEGQDYSGLYTNQADWFNVTLGLPLRFSPDSAFSYATPMTHLLSGIVAHSSGMNTYEFAEKYLFTPLNISVRYWYRDPKGNYFGGTGMYFAPRDLARLGFLYLNGGIVDGVPVISSQWIQESVQPRNHANASWGELDSVNYGYQWWMNNGVAGSFFFAAGFGGQFVVAVPPAGMVIVTTAEPPQTESEASSQEIQILHTIVRLVKSSN